MEHMISQSWFEEGNPVIVEVSDGTLPVMFCKGCQYWACFVANSSGEAMVNISLWAHVVCMMLLACCSKHLLLHMAGMG